ncbi:Osmotin, thaumatin-like protein, partial [Cylindrobasidium torrendii FP15055 ss-10]
ALVTSAYARKFTVTNNCEYTVWPAMYTDPNVGPSVPDHVTGWEAAAGSTEEFEVPDDWKAGRIWGRTECDFSTNPGPTSCVTGGCNGGLECDPNTGTGVPPVTVAEWTLEGDDRQD